MEHVVLLVAAVVVAGMLSGVIGAVMELPYWMTMLLGGASSLLLVTAVQHLA